MQQLMRFIKFIVMIQTTDVIHPSMILLEVNVLAMDNTVLPKDYIEASTEYSRQHCFAGVAFLVLSLLLEEDMMMEQRQDES